MCTVTNVWNDWVLAVSVCVCVWGACCVTEGMNETPPLSQRISNSVQKMGAAGFCDMFGIIAWITMKHENNSDDNIVSLLCNVGVR